MNPDSIRVEQYLMKWLDEPDNEPESVLVAFIDTPEQTRAIEVGLMGENWDFPTPSPEWLRFDEKIFLYIYTYLGESAEKYFKTDNNKDDFYLIGDN